LFENLRIQSPTGLVQKTSGLPVRYRIVGFWDILWCQSYLTIYQLPRTEINNSGSPILLKDSTIKHVLVQMDKKTAVAYVNKMGELFQKFFQTKPPFFGIGA
jgi:hypothetical protein